MKRSPFHINYQFQFLDGGLATYQIALSPDSLSLIHEDGDQEAAEWTRLDYEQCHCCPLTPEIHPRCPIAVNIMELVESFKNVFSYHDCTVVCETAERTYSKKTSVMEGLSAIFGVIMATSDCPVMEFLKPMARFHLPVANEVETLYRSASNYLLAQYFATKDGKKADLALEGLKDIYMNVKQVNSSILERLKTVAEKDSSLSAVVTLHMFAEVVLINIEESLDEVRYLFEPYLENS